MLSYLVTSRTRRALLALLWQDHVSGSVRQLATRAGTAYAATHRELTAMWRAGLAHRQRQGARTVFTANLDHPHADVLTALLSARASTDVPVSPAHQNTVLASLEALGAPLLVQPKPDPSAAERLCPEASIAAGVQLARSSATLARALPVVIHQTRSVLDFDRLLREARHRSEPHPVGMFLELTASLDSDARLCREASRFRDGRRRGVQDFFVRATSGVQRALAERNTPEVARRWGYRMNLGMDAFESTFARFCHAQQDTAR